VTAGQPGRDEVILRCPDGGLCNSLACVRAGRVADVVATFGVLNDPGSGYYSRGALWREMWGRSVPMCAGCWESTRQVALRSRPGLVVTDTTGDGTVFAGPQTAGGRE
jgi:hypothetical protein